ncbi:MAG: hypothetical protein ACRDAM_15960 [Casimicrobium sp.]
MSKARAIEVGQITTLDIDGEKNTHDFRMVIDFDSADALRDALEKKSVEFTFWE